jgi:hypothetical protein
MRNYIEFFERVEGEARVTERFEVFQERDNSPPWRVTQEPCGASHIRFLTEGGEEIVRRLGKGTGHFRLAINSALPRQPFVTRRDATQGMGV